jgi:hypothetical protein
MTSLAPEIVRRLTESGGQPVQRLDLVMIGLLGILLLEYDVLRTYFGSGNSSRLRPFGIAIAPLAIAFVVVIATRWTDLSH